MFQRLQKPQKFQVFFQRLQEAFKSFQKFQGVQKKFVLLMIRSILELKKIAHLNTPKAIYFS